ncbi:MAG: hypothetical protein IJB48_05550 [Clostridia bacterium]|nr:hypothetical protein [Clostridia bacterium]
MNSNRTKNKNLKSICFLFVVLSLCNSMGCHNSHTFSIDFPFCLESFLINDVFQGLKQISFKGITDESVIEKTTVFYGMDYPIPLEQNIGSLTRNGKIEFNELGKSLSAEDSEISSNDGYPMFWFVNPETETVAISAAQIRMWQNESISTAHRSNGELLTEINIGNLVSVSENLNFQIPVTREGDSVKNGSQVFFWREERGLTYYNSGKIDEGRVDVILSAGKTYHVCVFQSISEENFLVTFSEMTANQGASLDLHGGFKYKPTLSDKAIIGIFPMSKGGYPSRATSRYALHLFLAQTALFYEPQILCVFYEGNKEFDLVGEAGVLFASPDGLKTDMKKGIPSKDGESAIFFNEVKFQKNDGN